MNNRILVIVTLMLILCFSTGILKSVNPYGTRPGSKRVQNMNNLRTYYFPYSRVITDWDYYYSTTEPALVDSIIKTEATTSSNETTTIVTKSALSHSVQTVGNLTRTEYLEYRMPYETLIGRYVFIYNQDNDLVELIAKHLNIPDSVHVYYHYFAPAKPDSMYYKTCSGNNSLDFYFKLYYDGLGRLSHSVKYLNYYGTWTPYLRFTQNYGSDPYQYPEPLEFNDFRYYSIILMAFEDSSIIYDKYYASESIAYEMWDDWSESWEVSYNYYYGVDTLGDEIALLSNRNNDYVAYFYFDETGTYTGKLVYYTYLSDVFLNVTWDIYDQSASNDLTAAPELLNFSAYPNPFKNNLNIKIDSKTPINSDISIYNIKGQLIRSWNGIKSNELTWDGRDKDNKPVKSGVYLIKAGQGRDTSVVKVIKL